MTNNSTDSKESGSKSSPGELAAVIKSGDPVVQRFNEGTNSVVSDVAIDRTPENLLPNSYPTAASPASPQGEIAPVAAQAAQTLENLEIAVAKADALVQSVEQRQSEIEDAYSKAQAMLDEVNRIAEALTFSDALRERINATVTRTKRLRANDGKPLG